MRTVDRKAISKCPDCNHCFTLTINKITLGRWCPYCRKGGVSSQKICEEQDCTFCYERTVASIPEVKYWHLEKNGDIKPWQVQKTSEKICWFTCVVCQHDIRKTPYSISLGQWCGYCSNGGPVTMCDKIDCKWCYKKSFASHPRAAFWSKANGKLTPRQVSKYVIKSFLFDCADCYHTFKAPIANVTRRGDWCPRCKHKGEKQLGNRFPVLYDGEVTFQPSYDWCRNEDSERKTKLRFDYSLEKIKVIVELDGEQHYKDHSFFKSTAAQNQQRDLYKIKCAMRRGYTVIRLLHEQVHRDQGNWEQRLKLHLRKHPHPHVILLDSEKGEYDQLRKLLDEAKIVHLSA
jgi:hypothetical protein